MSNSATRQNEQCGKSVDEARLVSPACIVEVEGDCDDFIVAGVPLILSVAAAVGDVTTSAPGREDLLLILVLALFNELDLERTVRVMPLSAGSTEQLDRSSKSQLKL